MEKIQTTEKTFDEYIKILSSKQQEALLVQKSEILESFKANLTPIIQDNIQNSWKLYGTPILKFSEQALLAGVKSALISFLYQSAKIGTGNLQALNTNTLLISALTSLSANLIALSSKFMLNTPVAETALSSEGSTLLEEAIITPSIETKNYTVAVSAKSLLKSWILGESLAIINTMITSDDTIMQAIKNINIKQLLVGKEITPTSNALVAAIVPQVQSITNNPDLALALTEVGWICFQSAAIGGLLWSAGLGYHGTTVTQSINYSMLFGMIQGTLANLATLMNKTTPGAILTIASVPFNQQIATIAQTGINATPQTVLTGIFQTVATESINFILNESEKYGSLAELLKRGKSAVETVISSRWSNLWGAISETFATIQEIEPLPV